jgi:DNA-binding XRE family transcriptional regulator
MILPYHTPKPLASVFLHRGKEICGLFTKSRYYLLMRVKGEKIKLIREAKGWSVAELAEQAGVTRQAVESWEKGGVKKLETLAKIADKLGISPNALLETKT